jgi:hypothetical protein
MGLTVHYTFEFKGAKAALVKELEWLKNQYADFPVNSVGDILEIKQARLEKGFGKHGKELFSENHLGFMMSFCYFPETKVDKALMDIIRRTGGTAKIDELTPRDQKRFHRLRQLSRENWERRAERIRKSANGLLLAVDVGEGCESFDIMLGRLGKGRIWHGQGFTKTQYATHFHTCHLAVCEMLDFCKDAGILKRVLDDGQFYETRDIQELARNLNASTEMIQAVTGVLKGTAKKRGFKVSANIDRSANIMKVTRKKPRPCDG